MEAARLTATIDADSKEGEEGLKRFHGLLGNATEGFKGLLATAGGFALGGGILAGIGAIGGFLADAVKEGAAANEGIAQTEAVLKSTGGAAGVTADQVDKLSTQYMNLTGIQDDTVRASENMLLTFTNIGKDVFPQATKTVLDMSTALGQDTKNSAIQLGKALNDPEKGITALQRVGVTFDAQQKALIKTYMQHGDIAKAQGVILTELNKEFGGSAEAAGKANGGIKILSAQFDNLKQGLGQALIPILVQLMTALQPVIEAITNVLSGGLDALTNGPLGAFISDMVSLGSEVLGDVFGGLKNLFGGLNLLGAPFDTTTGKADGLMGLLGQLDFTFNNLVAGITKGQGPFANLHGIMQTVGTFVQTQLIPTILSLATWFETKVLPAVEKFAGFVATDVVPIIIKLVGWTAQNLIPIVKTLAEVFMNNVLPALEGVWDSISANLLPALEKLWNKISPILIPAFQLLGGILQNVVGPALSVIIDIVSHLIDLIANLADGIGNALGKLGQFKDLVGGALSHLPHFATGTTSTPGGQFVGAEQGPELLLTPGVYSAPRGSTVLNASDTRKALGGGRGVGGVTNNYNIYPAKAQFGPEELDVIQRRYALLGNTGGGY